MDGTTFLGILFAFLAVAGSQWIDGVSLWTLFNPSALMLVMVGSFAAVLLQTPFRILKRSLMLLPYALKSHPVNLLTLKRLLIRWSRLSRRSGVLIIERELNKLNDPFLVHSTEHLLSGLPTEILQEIIETEIETRETAMLEGAQVYESMGGYAPTIGIIGAVLGLIQVMQHLESPDLLGKGIAMAFVATVYGVGLANLVLLPLAHRLRQYICDQSRAYEMHLVGLLAIANGESPTVLAVKLNSYMRGEDASSP